MWSFLRLSHIVKGALCNWPCRDVVGWLLVSWSRSWIVAKQLARKHVLTIEHGQETLPQTFSGIFFKVTPNLGPWPLLLEPTCYLRNDLRLEVQTWHASGCYQVIRYRVKMWPLGGAPGVGTARFFWSEWSAFRRIRSTKASCYCSEKAIVIQYQGTRQEMHACRSYRQWICYLLDDGMLEHGVQQLVCFPLMGWNTKDWGLARDWLDFVD